jgi:predicted dehydrogenase
MSISWGIIGCGAVTEKKSGPAYQQVEGFELKAVMRRNAALAQDYARRHKVAKWYSDAVELINDAEIQAVYIATPPDSHEHYALMIAEAGKICCIEKPMAPDFAACQRILEAFEYHELPLFVAYYRRCLPRFETIRSWIQQGEIGVPRHVNWVFSRPPSDVDVSDSPNWRTEKDVAYGGYFDDLASHGLDLFCHYFGAVERVSGFSINQLGLYSSMDAVVGSWIHESNVTGSGTWNFGSEKRQDRVEILGSTGSIRFSMFGGEDIILEQNENISTHQIQNHEHIQFHHVQAMRDHLSGKRVHPSSGKTATHTAWVMDKILGK